MADGRGEVEKRDREEEGGRRKNGERSGWEERGRRQRRGIAHGWSEEEEEWRGILGIGGNEEKSGGRKDQIRVCGSKVGEVGQKDQRGGRLSSSEIF